MARPSRRDAGFTLLETAVAVAVVAILAGMMAPMALKALNQRREAATRRSLKRAFEAMFGARERRVANMRADFGFDPGGPLDRLAVMLSPAAWGAVPPYGMHPDADFPWGWNGPYWLGDIRAGAPVDAWGSPIQLLWSGGAVQLRSFGPGKREARNGQEILYPPVPVPLTGYMATVLVRVTPRDPGAIPAGHIAVLSGGNRAVRAREVARAALEARSGDQHQYFLVPAGALAVVVETGTGPGMARQVTPLDLLPGETREVRVQL